MKSSHRIVLGAHVPCDDTVQDEHTPRNGRVYGVCTYFEGFWNGGVLKKCWSNTRVESEWWEDILAVFCNENQKRSTREAFTSELLRVEQGVGAKRMFKNVVLRWPICRA